MKGKLLKLFGCVVLAATVLVSGLVMGPKDVKADECSHESTHWVYEEETHKSICDTCETVLVNTPNHIGKFKVNNEGKHQMECQVCGFVGSEHEYDLVKSYDRAPADCCYVLVCSNSECDTQPLIGSRHQSKKSNPTVCVLCGKGCPSYCVNYYHGDDEEEKEEEKKEESHNDSPAPAPVLTPAQQAKITEQAQAVVGSKAYIEKQAEVKKTVTTAVAAVAKLTPAQMAVVKNTGVAVNLGGCTTVDKATVVTMASNNAIPYNMGFTWNGVNFIVKIPAGVNYLNLVDKSGNLQMWRLVQLYGISGASIAK